MFTNELSYAYCEGLMKTEGMCLSFYINIYKNQTIFFFL